LVRELVADGLVLGVHDTADGLGPALFALVARSGVGAVGRAPVGAGRRWPFRETPRRFVLSVHPAALGEVHRRHTAAGVPGALLGEAGGDRFVVEGLAGPGVDLAVAEVVDAWEGKLPALLGHGTTQG